MGARIMSGVKFDWDRFQNTGQKDNYNSLIFDHFMDIAAHYPGKHPGPIEYKGKYLHVDLDWPPSVNSLYRIQNRRIVLSEKGKEYKRAMGRKALAERWPIVAGDNDPFGLLMYCYPKDKRVRDLDNLLKIVVDGLEYTGVIGNDRNNKLMLITEPGIDKEYPRIELVVAQL